MITVFIVSAPSGSGKSTLVNEIRQLVPGLDFSVSYTTRPPRGSEHGGREYYFVERPVFEAMVRNGDFLEYADVYGNYYGTPQQVLQKAEESGHDLLLDIDVQGAELVKQKLPRAVRIFILPPDLQTLERRLRNRGVNKEDDIQRRLATARREIENYSKYDYILVNDRLEESVANLEAIILSERLKHSAVAASARDVELAARAQRFRLASVQQRIQPILASFRQPRAEASVKQTSRS